MKRCGIHTVGRMYNAPTDYRSKEGYLIYSYSSPFAYQHPFAHLANTANVAISQTFPKRPPKKKISTMHHDGKNNNNNRVLEKEVGDCVLHDNALLSFLMAIHSCASALPSTGSVRHLVDKRMWHAS